MAYLNQVIITSKSHKHNFTNSWNYITFDPFNYYNKGWKDWKDQTKQSFKM